MSRALSVAVALALVTSAAWAQPVERVLPHNSLPGRVAIAEIIAVGKVAAFEDKTVSTEVVPGRKEKSEYLIAVIKIEDHIFGAKGLTHFKLGLPKPPEPGPDGRPVRSGFLRLEVNQEAIFFVHKHLVQSFYIPPSASGVLNKAGNDNFEKETKRVKECAKLLADPKASLKSKDAGERALTAAMLVVRYTTPWAGTNRREPIDAEESKLILSALADGDWTKEQSLDNLPPSSAFSRLDLTEKDGWKSRPARNAPPAAFADAAKAWLQGHAESYRIQRTMPPKDDR
jgi:hypothetical protein